MDAERLTALRRDRDRILSGLSAIEDPNRLPVATLLEQRDRIIVEIQRHQGELESLAGERQRDLATRSTGSYLPVDQLVWELSSLDPDDPLWSSKIALVREGIGECLHGDLTRLVQLLAAAVSDRSMSA